MVALLVYNVGHCILTSALGFHVGTHPAAGEMVQAMTCSPCEGASRKLQEVKYIMESKALRIRVGAPHYYEQTERRADWVTLHTHLHMIVHSR